MRSKFEYHRIKYERVKDSGWNVLVYLDPGPDSEVFFPFSLIYAFKTRSEAEEATVKFIADIERYPFSRRMYAVDRAYLNFIKDVFLKNGKTPEEYREYEREWKADKKAARAMKKS